MTTNPANTTYPTDQSASTNPLSTHNNPSTTTTTTTTTHKPHTSTDNGEGVGHKLKAGLAAVHGTGEALRGSFNSTVDGAFNESTGVAKNQRVENEGLNEISSGHFGGGTKVREGAVPGDGGKRKNETF